MASSERPGGGKVGCWFMPAVLGISLVGAGVWIMGTWAAQPAMMKALSVMLVAFGALMLLPVALYIVFRVWMGRLKRTLDASMGEIKVAMEKIASDTKAIYDTPQEYRAAEAGDFEGVDREYYEGMERKLVAAGYRKLGDIRNQTLLDMGKVSPPMRVMLSSGGTAVAAIYEFSAGEMEMSIVDIETAFSDGTFLVVTNTQGVDVTTPPAQITRRQFDQEAEVAEMLAAHGEELAKLVGMGRTCEMMQTLEDVMGMQRRMHEVKRAALAGSGYVDRGAVGRIAAKMAGEGADEEMEVEGDAEDGEAGERGSAPGS